MSLSASARDRFRDDGYLVFDPEIPPPIIDRAVADLDARWDKSESRPDVTYAPRMRNTWEWSEALRQITTWPRSLAVLAELYGRPAFPWQTLSFRVGTEQAIHSDTIHFDTVPEGFICGLWVALEDMDASNGPLMYCPGTHTWKQYRMEDVGVPSARPFYKDYEAFMRERIAAANPRTEQAIIKKGQAVLWHGNLLHGGAPRLDPRRTRLSHVTHYAIEGSRLYTPLRSRGRRRFVRNPRPIVMHEGIADKLSWASRFLRPWFLWHAVTHNVPHLAKTHILGQE